MQLERKQELIDILEDPYSDVTHNQSKQSRSLVRNNITSTLIIHTFVYLRVLKKKN